MATAIKNSAGDRRGGLRILIVEDGHDSATSMALLLQFYGHQVMICTNGPDAIESARLNHPEVVLLDIGLPGMDGHAVAKQIGEWRNGKTPLLVAVTGFGQESDRRRSAEVGIDLHLLKPVNPLHLESLLRQFQTEICPVSAAR